jgi:hypothetical protein
MQERLSSAGREGCARQAPSHLPIPTHFLRHFHNGRMLLQHLLEIPPRMGGGMPRHFLWGSRHHNLPALIATFWTQIDDPVGAANHIEVVLNHQH